MSQIYSNVTQQDAPTLKIRSDDWQRMPAWFKNQIGGVPRVLSKLNGVAMFVPVHII